jgi:two-component system sensor histidine kinase UhpB
MLEQMLDTTRSGLDETRRALSALRASPLEDLGLGLAVRALSEDFTKRYALQLELDISDNLDELPPEVEQTFYRVAQEALENIARHAQANQVELTLSRVPSGLILTVMDDGLGFVVSDNLNETKHGLKGIKERAELIDAQLSIESRPGNGAKIELAWLGE